MADTANAGLSHEMLTSVPIFDFAASFDPFNSHLNLMRVNQNSQKSDGRPSFPFSTCPCPWEDIQFDIHLASEDLDNSQYNCLKIYNIIKHFNCKILYYRFEQKFLLNFLTDESSSSNNKHWTPTQTDPLYKLNRFVLK